MAFHTVELLDVAVFVFKVDVVEIMTAQSVGFDVFFVIFVFYKGEIDDVGSELKGEGVHAAGVLFVDFFSHCVHVFAVALDLADGFVVQVVYKIEFCQTGCDVGRLAFYYRSSIVNSLFHISHYSQTQNAVCVIEGSVQRAHEDGVVFFEIDFDKLGQDEFLFEFFYVVFKDFSPVHSRHDFWMSFLFQDLRFHLNALNLEIFVLNQDKIRALCFLFLLKNKHKKLLVVQKLCVYFDVPACEVLFVIEAVNSLEDTDEPTD